MPARHTHSASTHLGLCLPDTHTLLAHIHATPPFNTHRPFPCPFQGLRQATCRMHTFSSALSLGLLKNKVMCDRSSYELQVAISKTLLMYDIAKDAMYDICTQLAKEAGPRSCSIVMRRPFSLFFWFSWCACGIHLPMHVPVVHGPDS